MQRAIIGYTNGLNADFTVLVVQEAYRLQLKYKTKLSIHYKDYKEIASTDFGLLVGLQVRKDDEVLISSKENFSSDAVQEMVRFLENKEEQVCDLSRRFNSILGLISDGISLLDKKGYIVFVNAVFSSLVQRLSEDLQGKHISEVASNVWENRDLSKSSAPAIVPLQYVIRPILADDVEIGYIILIKDDREVNCLKEKNKILKLKAENMEKQLAKEKEANWHPYQYIGQSSEKNFIKKIKMDPAFEKFIGMNEQVLNAIALAAKAAKVQSTVLITGKSGTGKEVVAEGIHLASPRAKQPFIKINCAAIPGALLESELFGHEKGAFTGAIKRKLGKFELADGGTLFLDEIGEMEMSMQTKLLRILQTSSFERVGGEETIMVNVRILAATNQNLEVMVKEGRFREDLYYRLNVIPVSLPPLKDRKDDIPLLVDFFLKKFNKDFGRGILGIKKTTMDALISYDWPGNVRELKNTIERVVALADNQYIELSDLNPSILQNTKSKIDNKVEPMFTSLVQGDIFLLEEYEKQVIKAALQKYGSYTAAGKVLGITHKTVAAKAQKYGIDKNIENG
ncbi:sigma-54-dependent Fis family transcriptional regulator [Pelosinus sp. UFO1]|uniref:sigma-54 interaction domain-containing protein n=1 Tax=Pelosinus sp. UFO1 TaxID=484770 RepID=UPI0004D1EF17|nr:sigma 54-interacting transcriptional regulator [Pelosinus sp. UFO1]AIF53882.1 PAS modulated sigma54 specific transcriptional regulator, Fis family [Pelosinus sp. UFO1]